MKENVGKPSAQKSFVMFLFKIKVINLLVLETDPLK